MEFFTISTRLNAFPSWLWITVLFSLSALSGVWALRVAKRKGYCGWELFWACCPLLNICALPVFHAMPDRMLRARLESLTAKTAYPASTKERSVPPQGGENPGQADNSGAARTEGYDTSSQSAFRRQDMPERFYTHLLPAVFALLLAIAIPYIVLAAERPSSPPNESRELEAQERQSGQRPTSPMGRNEALREAEMPTAPQAPAPLAPLPANPPLPAAPGGGMQR